ALPIFAGQGSVVEISTLAALDEPFAEHVANPDRSALEVVGYSLDGGARQSLVDAGSAFTVPGLAAGDGSLQLFMQRGQAEHAVTLTYAASKVKAETSPFEDGEMTCTGSVTAPATESPLDLSKLQGGAASCGVVDGEGSHSPWALFLALLPVAMVLFRSRPKAALTIVCVAVASVSFQARAEGINALHYQPVADG